MLIYVCCVRYIFFNVLTLILLEVVISCLILSTIIILIPVSGCVGRGPGARALLCPGAHTAVKTALSSIYNKDLNHFV